MGEVWRAYDTVTNRIVALKMLLPHSADDADFQRRFRREAQVAASLNDPHVVPIHDYGEIDDRLFVTMRLIDGRDLSEVLRSSGGPLPPARAVHVVEQVAEALDAAHAVGLVHRDIKPSNVLLTPRDFVYLIDFGIAHTAGATRFTSTGVAVGTLAYMSPERFEANVSEPPSDIYALTCVLYECLTGQLPFPGDSLPQQIAAHLTKPPPAPSAIAPHVPTAFDDVVAKGMAKAPVDRYPTAIELASAARAALNVEAPPAPAPPTAPPPFTLPLESPASSVPHAPPPGVPHPPTTPRAVGPDRLAPAIQTARMPDPAPRPAPVSTPAHSAPAERPLTEPVAPQRKSRALRPIALAIAGLVIVLVIVGLVLGSNIIRSYYVAEQDDTVYIMHGVPGSFLGITLADRFKVACLDQRVYIRLMAVDDDRSGCHVLKVNDLDQVGQQQVRAGLPSSGNFDDAFTSLEQLVRSSLLPVCSPAARPVAPPPEIPTTVEPREQPAAPNTAPPTPTPTAVTTSLESAPAPRTPCRAAA